jgi:DNA-nicking Smr family endonuclease
MKDYITNVKPLNSKHVITMRKKSEPKFARKTFSYELFVPIKSQLHPISRKLHRKFTCEKIIDLHGLTQNEAFRKLLLFFSKCQNEKIKKVIVITGGNVVRKTVIRSSFQEWVKNSFGNYVVSCSSADISHGGQGAFYVILKSK